MTRPHTHEIKLSLALMLVAISVYLIWPELDLWVAGLFYTPTVGFEIASWPVVQAWHEAVPLVGRGMLVVALLVLVFGKKIRLSLVTRRRALALTVGMVMGIGLIIHAGFKDNWGRPRPVHLSDFGAAQTYVSPLTPSNSCNFNCASFMSGHASTGFALISVGALAGTRTRRRWLRIGWGAGLILGLVRMAQGGHFLGDIVFGGFVLWICSWLTRMVYVRWRARRIFCRTMAS
jgi:lipid A 4'-phosphatase